MNDSINLVDYTGLNGENAFCPFCGSKELTNEDTSSGQYVACEECGAFGPDASFRYSWNRRYVPPGYTEVKTTQLKYLREYICGHAPLNRGALMILDKILERVEEY